jgi:AraC-like DNA-binding protein
MIILGIGKVTTGAAAIGKIDVLRIHAAELYVAPAIGEFYACKCWRDQAESFFFGQWADVKRAHAMLAMIRSAMEREFADFFETGKGGENPKMLATNFSKGMGLRLSQRLRQLKAGRAATILARSKDLAAVFAKLLQRTPFKRDMPTISTIAYAAGVKAGDRVELISPGLKGGSGRSFLAVND